MKPNKELNQQVLNTSVDKKGRPTINIDKRKSIYTSTSEALKAIPITNRNVGLTVPIYNGIKVVEYWWEKGIKDSDLVKKINGDDIPRIDAKLVDLQNQINEVDNIEFKIFDSLPELGKSSIIYVIPNTTTQEDDDFIEYIWIKSQQRYQRFGGLNVDGNVIINNLYNFDSNVFNIDEEFNIKNISLNDKKISIGNNGITIYKFDVGEINNTPQVNIDRTIYNTENISYGGGHVSLYGYYNQNGSNPKTYTTFLNYNNISINIEDGDINFRSVLSPTELDITDNDTKRIIISKDGIEYTVNDDVIFEMNTSNFNSISDSVSIKAMGSNGFDINYDYDIGIKGFLDNDVKKISLYTPNTNITLIEDNITLSISEDSYIELTYDTFNARFNQSIYLDAPITKVKKVLFKSLGTDIYLDAYHAVSIGVTYHGLKSNSNIYIEDSNRYYIKNQSDYSLTSYGLNEIKHRDANTSTGLGYNILTIGDEGELHLGKNSELTINSDGHFIINGYENSKIGLLGENNINSYFIIEEGNFTLPDMKLQQNQYNFIYLYKDDNTDENCITIQSDYFKFINRLNETVFSIEQNDYIVFKTGDAILFKLGSKTITINETGISDGTNTKTWAQLLS